MNNFDYLKIDESYAKLITHSRNQLQILLI